MPYQRKGRPSWYSQVRTRDGWTQLSWRTPDKRLAEKMEAMWEELANEHRAWDVLDPVLQNQMTPGRLFDLWRESKRKVVELRRLMNDVDLEPLIAPFLLVHGKKVKPDSLRHIEVHVRWLIVEGTPFPRSLATTEHLTERLYAYKGKPGTIRKVHSDWSVFFDYCTTVRGLFERNPMETVARPPASKPTIRFYELDVVERIVGWQPTSERRALFALLYGTGMEPTVALGRTKADINPARKEIRAPGTKTHTRDRVARVADWAWPILWAHVKDLLPTARLFPTDWTRSGIYFWHEQTIGEGSKTPTGEIAAKGLKLDPALPPYCARHHWAVRQLRAGAPIRLVQEQLGHASPKLTLDTYGQFRPSAADRDRWEEAATNYERERRGETPAPASTPSNEGHTATDTASPEAAMLSNSRGGT